MVKNTLFFFIVFLFLANPIQASQSDRFITIVNPVRVAKANPDLVANLTSQYSVIKQYGLPATWLLTYDVLNNPKLTSYLKSWPKDQELGLFFEVSPDSAKASGFTYKDTGSWHFGSSVFLTGYTQDDRKKFIDTSFAKFKEVFGHYPTSVGAWWIDSFSLSYMREKYQITVNLNCSDQFSTDNYQIWGQYWSTPFYPSKFHAGSPAQTPDNKIGLVTLQWAARHPRDGYTSSLYSTQDYFVLNRGYTTEYFKKLLDIYLSNPKNSYSHITVGLESDLSPDAYQNEFKKQMAVVAGDNAKKMNMAEFGSWYQKRFPDLSPAHYIEADGVLWYQTSGYRIGIDKVNKSIIDLRTYPRTLLEPYYDWPQSEKTLRIYIPSIVDTNQNPNLVWKYDGEDPIFYEDHIELSTNHIPDHVKSSKYIDLKIQGKKVSIFPKNEILYQKKGLIFSDWTSETMHLFASPKALIKTLLKDGLTSIKKQDYLVSPWEIEGLEFLRLSPPGKILLYDHECLQCSWIGEHKPAVFANHREYVKRLTKKQTIIDRKVIEAVDRTTGKLALSATGAKYVYLVKYGEYQERLPFSPGDYGVELLFENAFSQIWLVK